MCMANNVGIVVIRRPRGLRLCSRCAALTTYFFMRHGKADIAWIHVPVDMGRARTAQGNWALVLDSASPK